MNIENVSLWLAGITMLVAIVLYVRARDQRGFDLARRFVYAHVALLTLALGMLFYLFLADKFQFEYVSHNSSRAQELFYKISALWAGQEGTFLLWAWIIGILAIFVMRRGGEYLRWAMIYLLATQAFLLILMYVRSPFALIEGAIPADGNGLFHLP